MKALASDYDGTLYFREINNCKEEDLKAIKQLQKEGSLFGICTGRPYEGIRKFIPEELKPDFFIVSSGASILNKNHEVIYEKALDIKVAEQLCELYTETDYVSIQAGQTVFAYKKKRPWTLVSREVIQSLDEIAGMKIYGYSYSLSSEEQAEKFVQKIYSQFPDVCEAFQNGDSVDVVAKGCSKGNAIIKIKELLDIDVCYGIGDSYNDIPMLQKADTSFTFHRSATSIQACAEYIVDSVAEAIQKYIL